MRTGVPAQLHGGERFSPVEPLRSGVAVSRQERPFRLLDVDGQASRQAKDLPDFAPGPTKEASPSPELWGPWAPRITGCDVQVWTRASTRLPQPALGPPLQHCSFRGPRASPPGAHRECARLLPP